MSCRQSDGILTASPSKRQRTPEKGLQPHEAEKLACGRDGLSSPEALTSGSSFCILVSPESHVSADTPGIAISYHALDASHNKLSLQGAHPRFVLDSSQTTKSEPL